MKTVHYCDVCGKDFPTPEEALACEKRHAEEKARKEALAKTREDRLNELNNDIKAFEKKYNKFCDDYNEYPSISIACHNLKNPFYRFLTMI